MPERIKKYIKNEIPIVTVADHNEFRQQAMQDDCFFFVALSVWIRWILHDPKFFVVVVVVDWELKPTEQFSSKKINNNFN